jgi:hypothetical protein
MDGSLWRAQGSFTFENGWTISMVYGSALYCSCTNSKHPLDSCEDVEVAIIDPKGNFHPFLADEVRGYTNANDLAKIITWVSEQKAD